MKRKLGIVGNCFCGKSALEALDLIKEAGFEAFFTNEYQYDDVKAIKDKALKLGLEYEFIHAPFQGINNMWLKGDSYLDIYNKMIETIESCYKCGIKTVIIHTSSTINPPSISDIGLKRYDDLVSYATERKITIAFENLRKVGYVSYFADRYHDKEFVSFCYDIGHENIYAKKGMFVSIFGKRITCTHVHDNLGNVGKEPDMHILPFDGNIDYKYIINRLDEINYCGSIMLELNNDNYKNLSEKEFIKEAFKRAQTINNYSEK